MRIIAGRLGGRIFESPHSRRTHPMSDKVRGGLFNVLGNIDNLTLLDAFAGSGAVSFEAQSRGVKQITAIDIDKKAVDVMRTNARNMGIDNSLKIIRANASSWSDNNESLRFDIVIADPPYDDLQIKLIEKLIRHLKNNGIFVLAWPGKLIQPEFLDLTEINQKNYGDAQLVFYRRVS